MPAKAIDLFTRVDKPNDVILNLVLNACAQLRTDDALKLVREVASKMSTSSYSNVFVVNSLLDALMKCGDVLNARSLFDASTKKDVSMYGAMMKGNSVSHHPNERTAVPRS